MVFDKFISKVLSNDKRNFNEVCVDNKVIDSVIYYAKESYPNEFLAFFDGHVKDNKLILDSLLWINFVLFPALSSYCELSIRISIHCCSFVAISSRQHSVLCQ